MSDADERRAELLRRFEAVISDPGLDDLRDLAEGLSLLGAAEQSAARTSRRPELRRPPLPELRRFRVRADLRRARPPIWRRLELRSDLTLEMVHRVLQVAFGWTDTHLWRFALGGDPLDPAAQAFLCPWDVEEDEADDEGCPPASEVRLDEVMREPGDVLSYLYDYGDNWELRLQLEDVSPADAGTPAATLLDGRRAAPPEDCGGLTEGAELARVISDPERFDAAVVEEGLQDTFFLLAASSVDPRLGALLARLAFTPLGEELRERADALLAEPPAAGVPVPEGSLRAFTWFLERAADGGIPLTGAGYLRPVDVQQAARMLPGMDGWIGKANRESETIPVLHFRRLLQSLGLLRRYKGTLRLTRAGVAAGRSNEALWDHLAAHLIPGEDRFEAEATLLVLLFAAGSPHAELPVAMIARALTSLGWRTAEREELEGHDLVWLDAVEALRNVGDLSGSGLRWRISPAAALLARAALHRPRTP